MKTILVMVQVKGEGAICHHECPYLLGSSQNVRCNLFHRGLYTGAAFPKRVEACIDGEKHAAGVLKPDP